MDIKTENTFTKTCDMELFLHVQKRAEKANARAEKNGLTGRIVVTHEPAGVRYRQLFYRDQDGHLQTLLDSAGNPATEPVERVTVSVTLSGEFTIGDFTPVCFVEFEGDEFLPIFNTVLEGVERHRDVSPNHCDHCNHTVARRSIWVVQDTDGVQYHVGSTCIADYLGVEGEFVLDLHRTIAEFGAEFDMTDEDDEFEFRVVDRSDSLHAFVACAITACAMNGYQKKGSALPTVEHAMSIPLDETMSDASQWAEIAINHWANIVPSNDFERNLHTIATAGTFKLAKHAGLAAYMGEGFRREFVKWVNLCNAKEERSAIPAELHDTRTEINGTVISTALKVTAYGEVEKMRVEDERGFIVYGTNFNDAQQGDSVRFVAKIAISDKDNTFGFFTRPKAL